MPRYEIHLPTPHQKQAEFIGSQAKRKVVRAGRRGGKTVGMSVCAVEMFLAGKRVLYGAPTADQLSRFWRTVTDALHEPITAGVFYKNETEHIIERRGTEQRIRAKTAWNADTLRGDYADVLILDEYQLMNEDAWGVVGAPMLLDNDGNAIFIYTPPSLHSAGVTKAQDAQHAAKLYRKAAADTSGRWATFHFRSMDNPYISQAALAEIANDMTALAYRQEILAEDVDEAPGALWKRDIIEQSRVVQLPELERVVVAIDPSATARGDEAGIIVAGKAGEHFYPLADCSMQGSPLAWATAAVTAYHVHQADRIIAETNNGGEMVEIVLRQVDPNIPYKGITATRGKQVRAEPVAAIYEQGRGHHVGSFPLLEDELCQWTPGDASPNRLDALVWAGTELMLDGLSGQLVY
jgi:hypothetical protein